MLWKSRRTRRTWTGGIACKASKWLRISLGLFHPSIDLVLVALIRVYPTWMLHGVLTWTLYGGIEKKKESTMSSAALKILPQSSQNPLKILQKPSQTHFQNRTYPKFVRKSIFFTILDDFWRFCGRPRPSKILQNSQKDRIWTPPRIWQQWQ